MTDDPLRATLRDTPHRARLMRVVDRVAPFGVLRSELLDCIFDVEAAALASQEPADPREGLEDALSRFCEVVDRSLVTALIGGEDGAPVPGWQENIADALDEAHAALAQRREDRG